MSYWVCQDCRALTALYPDHYSRLSLQSAALSDKVMSPQEKEQACVLLAIKAEPSPSSLLLQSKPTACAPSIVPGGHPREIWGQRDFCEHAHVGSCH